MRAMKFDAKNNVIEQVNLSQSVLDSAIIGDEGKFNFKDDKDGEYWMLEQGVIVKSGDEGKVIEKPKEEEKVEEKPAPKPKRKRKPAIK